jgi:hypothetical protein
MSGFGITSLALRPRRVLGGVAASVSGVTPMPALAWSSRTLSPPVTQRCAWWSNRSTVAVASVAAALADAGMMQGSN